ncbi:MAG: putative quinol monooxygenase [bacterium]|nr:putative quinol monooxygenase [bacterium]
MISIVGRFRVRPDKRESFLEFAEYLIDHSRQEIGCESFGIYEDILQQDWFVMLEEWQNQDTLEKHRHTAHFARFIQEFNDYLEGEAVFRVQEG